MKRLLPALAFVAIMLGAPAHALFPGRCPDNSDRAHDGHCYCHPGYRPSEDARSCVAECPPPLILDPQTGRCRCMPGSEWSLEHGRCVEPGWSACPDNSYMSNDLCICYPGFEFDPRTGRCVRPDEQCPPNSTPSGFGCVCDPGYRFDSTGRVCLPFYDQVSCPEGARLVGTRCVCTPPFEPHGEGCAYLTPCRPLDFVVDERTGAANCFGGDQCVWEASAGKCTDRRLTTHNCGSDAYWDLEENRCACRPPVSAEGYYLDSLGRHLVCCRVGDFVTSDGRCAFRRN